MILTYNAHIQSPLLSTFDNENTSNFYVLFSYFQMMFSTPGNFNDTIKAEFMTMFIQKFGMCGANIVNQTLLSLYSYNSQTGIVVDIGERLEIVPVTDGKTMSYVHCTGNTTDESKIRFIISSVILDSSVGNSRNSSSVHVPCIHPGFSPGL